MTKRIKLAIILGMLSTGLMLGACSTGEVIQQTAQAGYTLAAATPLPGGLGLADGHR